jgi:membrane protein required for beta-lactamase induction
MRTPPRSLLLLFVVALMGVLVTGGLLAAVVGGLPLVLVYLVVVGVLVGLGAVRARRLVAPPAPAARACSCCDGDHSRPVTVI